MTGRSHHGLGYAIGAIAGGIGVMIFATPGMERLSAPGPASPGHGALDCDDCHTPAPGSIRQQLQAIAGHALGLRTHAAELGMRPIGNDACTSCHERPDDRHPPFRFLEPRFAEIRRELAPERCVSCHAEHRGAALTAELDLCRHCHADLVLEEDPIEPPHALLVRVPRFDTCLRCHDFHGNHEGEAPTALSRSIPERALRDYLSGGPSPYPQPTRHPARKERPPR